MERFEEIIAWKKSKELVVEIYKEFKDKKDYSFKDQIQRATVSIMNNIAEGFERGTDKELIHFLYIAKGSCGETRSMLYTAHDLQYIPETTMKNLIEKCEEISKIISGFIRQLV